MRTWKNRNFVILAILTIIMMTPAFAEEIRVPGLGYSSTVSARTSAPVSFGAAGEEIYRVGPNDVLEIAVWQNPELNRTVTVRYDGRISLPLAGEVAGAGLTPAELSVEIAERLREFVRSPQVTVTVKEFHSRQVLVLGTVGRPGIYPLRGPMKILELLTVADIDLSKINLSEISVIRASGEVLKIDLTALLYRQDVRQNIDLRAGDNIFVPERVVTPTATDGPGQQIIEPKKIMVLGEVDKPGMYSFSPGENVDVNLLLLQAGGPTKLASLKSAKIIRADKIQEPIDLNKLIFGADMSQNLDVFSGDVLYVPKSELMRVYVLGMVARPGVYEGQPKKLDLMQVLSQANPDKFGAVLSNVKVVRGWPQNPKVINANVEALLHQGKLEENIPLAEGDVVYVPESFLSNVIDVVTRVLTPLTGSVSFIDEAQDISDNSNNN